MRVYIYLLYFVLHFIISENMANTTDLHAWLDEYSISHQDPTNIIIHKICVPTIAFTFLGFLWSVPLPKFIRQTVGSSLSHIIPMLAIAPTLAFYFRLSTKMAGAMTAIVLLAIALLAKMQQSRIRIFRLSLVVFVLAWIGQFIGHHIEGKKPSFFEDLQFLAIGPLWTLASAFRALGIAY